MRADPHAPCPSLVVRGWSGAHAPFASRDRSRKVRPLLSWPWPDQIPRRALKFSAPAGSVNSRQDQRFENEHMLARATVVLLICLPLLRRLIAAAKTGNRNAAGS